MGNMLAFGGASRDGPFPPDDVQLAATPPDEALVGAR